MSIPKWKIYLPRIIGITSILVVTLGLVWLIYDSMTSEPVKYKKQVQKVTLFTPPPPPPPKVEQPPEPEVQEEVDLPEPEALEDLPEMSDEPPLGELGLDADGAAGSDAFGLIGRKGGRGLLDGDPHVLYASELQKMIEELLIEHENIRQKAYSVVAQIWVGKDGSIIKAKLSRTTGDKKIDDTLVDMITGIPMMAQAPPQDMPQPIKLRISSRL